LALYGFAMLLLVAFSWRSRMHINPDGISYLDVSQQMLKGDLRAYFHPYWSPLFPALLALATIVIPAGSAKVLLLAHAIIAISALAGLAAFIFFTIEWRRLLRARSTLEPDEAASSSRVLFDLALFLSVTIVFVSTDNLTPDILVLAVVLAIAGTTCRLAEGRGQSGSAIALGLLLGIGYFSKAALFPLGLLLLVFLTISWFGRPALRIRLGIAMLVFVSLTAPYIAALSTLQNRPIFGDSAKLNYSWLVLRNTPLFAGWTKGSENSGTPVHPPRVLGSSPTVLEFDHTTPGTLPVWYDPSFFYQGLKTHFDLRLQFRQLRQAPAQALRNTRKVTLTALVLLAVLAMLAHKQSHESKSAVPWLIAWAISAYVMYGAVELLPRFVGPFFVIFVTVVTGELFDRIRTTSILLNTFLLLGAAALLLMHVVFSRLIGGTISAESDGKVQQVLANDLRGIGVEPNEKIAILGDPFNVYFAFQDKLQVVATIGFRGGNEQGDSNMFWSMNAKSQALLEDQLASLGVSAIISSSPCGSAAGSEWLAVGNHHYCALVIHGR